LVHGFQNKIDLRKSVKRTAFQILGHVRNMTKLTKEGRTALNR